jgi:hypothetical protein
LGRRRERFGDGIEIESYFRGSTRCFWIGVKFIEGKDFVLCDVVESIYWTRFGSAEQ